MNIETQDRELNQMIMQGKALEAFEKFYADDVVMCENFDQECKGKDANRKREQEFFGSIEKVHQAKLGKYAVQGDTSFGEMTFDVTYKGGKRVEMSEVSVRQWKDGKVVHERFYYKPSA